MRAVSIASIFAALALAAVQAPAFASDEEPTQIASFNPHNFKFPAGVYRCELNRTVDVRQVAADLKSAVLRWNQKDYTLRAINTHTGALRYEDPMSGLVWLVIVGKAMLLDTKQGKQLANECKV